MLKIGPPELPGLIGASSCRKLSNGPAPRSRPRAETMPAVTEPPRPNGLPAASTQSPTSTWRESPHVDGGQRAGRLHLDQRHVGQFVGADHLGGQPRAVGQRDHDLVGVTDHVVVGHDQAGRVDDEARAGAHRLLLSIAEAAAELAAERRVAQFRRQFAQHLAAGDGLGHRDVHHRRQHALDQRREALRRRAGDGAAGYRGAGGGDAEREPAPRAEDLFAGDGGRQGFIVFGSSPQDCVSSRWHAVAVAARIRGQLPVGPVAAFDGSSGQSCFG